MICFFSCKSLSALIIFSIHLSSLRTLKGSSISEPKSEFADLIECYKVGKPLPRYGKRLLDVLDSERKPRPGKTIFFHETRCSSDGFLKLGPREVCSIESAAKHNPNLDVFVLFTSPRFYLTKGTSNDLLRLQQTYNNIFLRNNDMWKYSNDTAVAKFLETEKIFESSFIREHLSDFLRLISIWKYGGIYMDTDIVVKKTFENLSLNYGGLAGELGPLNNGLISLDSSGFGHSIGRMFIDDFIMNFSPKAWAANGPGVITRVLKKVCNATNLEEIPADNCHGFKVYPRGMFWAMNWIHAKDFFDSTKLERLLDQTHDSYSIHMFNHLTKNIIITEKSLYDVIAGQNCPLTYNSIQVSRL